MDRSATDRSWDTPVRGLFPGALDRALGWAATTIGVVLLATTGMAPVAVSVPLGIAGIAVGIAALIAARSRHGHGAGFGVAGIVFASVAVVAAVALWALTALTGVEVGADPRSGGLAGPAGPDGPAPPAAGAPEVVRLMPEYVAATATAPPSSDGGTEVVTFDATKVLDGDPTTAWRTTGDGVGETITVGFAEPVRLAGMGMIVGHGGTNDTEWVDRFGQNGRVASARFTLDDGHVTDVTFVDSPQLQTFEITGDTTAVQVSILSSTPGSAPYTAISEIEFYGWKG